ncbi:zinc-binding dehydrogenase [Streptomyces lydicus]|uniref:zinc-binding dehydrogenase n=1 Tax=Streptomyces lydicus TaxID=47763 RepID=UPI00343E5234
MPDRYEVVTCTPDGRPVRSSSDFRVASDHGPEALERADTVAIPPFDLRLLDDGLPAPTATALAAAGTLRAHIDATFPLAEAAEAAEAHARAETGRTTEKIVLVVG